MIRTFRAVRRSAVLLSGVAALAGTVLISPSAAFAATVSFSKDSYTVTPGKLIYVGLEVSGITAPTTATMKVTGGTAQGEIDFIDPGAKAIPFLMDGVTEKGIGFQTVNNPDATYPKTVIFSVVDIDGQTPASPITATVTLDTAATAAKSAGTLDCPPEPAWGSNIKIPLIYLPPAGTAIQIDKPFKISVRGISADADITTNDTQITFGPKVRAGGAAGQYAFDQIVTVTGAPRTVTFRVSAGGTAQAICRSADVQRAAHAYTMTVALDKTAFGSGEAFKVTVSGLPREKAGPDPVVFSRSNASYMSCENPMNQGPNTTCEGDSIMSCGLLSGTADTEYLCAATRLDTSGGFLYPNKAQDVTYTVKLGNTSDMLDTYTFPGSPQSITLYRQGTHSDGGVTNYGSCPTGQGVNPASPSTGCTRCLNISTQFRSHITSCATAAADAYQWVDVGPVTGFDVNIPKCDDTVAAGTACTVQGAGCAKGTEKFQCQNPVTTAAAYHGKVIDASTGAPLPGVLVQSGGVTAGYLDLTCPGKTTNSSGAFQFSAAESQSPCLNPGAGAWLDYSKAGYQSGRSFPGSEYDKLVPTFSLQQQNSSGPSALSIDPSERDQTMDLTNKNTLTVTVHNANSGIDACYQVLHRDPDAATAAGIAQVVTTEPSISACAWANNWTGNSDWHFVGNDLVGTFPFSNTWNIPGLVVRSSFRDHNNPLNIVSATMRFSSGAKSATVTSYTPIPLVNTIISSVGGLWNRWFGATQ